MMRPHHDGSGLYVSDPAPGLGDTVDVFVRVPRGTGVSRVHLRWLRDGEPVFSSAVVDRRDASGDTWWRAELPVRNPVTPYRFLLGTTAGVRWLTGLGVTTHDVPDATDFRLVAHPPAPAWARDAVVYQIFPERFARSGTAGTGGDLDGIAQRLDHIGALGANTIYLTPFFPAGSGHRYDATAFDRVDPLLGGDDALARLSAAVHERGWRLIGDLTTNHTGIGHPWFVTEPDFYYRDADGGYESWLGVPSLPKLNWGSPALRKNFHEIVQHWLTAPYHLDGWRIDVANMTGRSGADDRTHEVAALLAGAVRECRPDGLLVAEHGHDASADLDRDGWHGTMNYAGFTRPVWSWLRGTDLPFDDFLGVPAEVPRRDAGATVATITAFAAQMSWRSWTTSWQLLGSHDTARIRTVVGDPARHEVAAGLLMTLPGTPMIFAGDEIGLEGAGNEQARAPLPWDRPDSWDTATLGTYQALIALRKASPALREGGLRWVHADGDTLLFLRECAAERVLVLARRAPGEPLRLPGKLAGNLYGGGEPLYTEADGSTAIDGHGPTFQVWSVHN
jgi:alpha-glucosidase